MALCPSKKKKSSSKKSSKASTKKCSSKEKLSPGSRGTTKGCGPKK